jgi:catechol 2,3-dioxygenase-like lactoylglutathione lyase family enzyme
MSVTVEDPSARVCAGVDWAKDDHAVCVVDADGEVLDRFTVEHTAAGLKRLIARLLRAGVVEVGIERGDGPVVEALLAAELVVFVIAPSQLKNLRSRYGSAGNKDDRYDAYVLADVVRTDRRRLSPLTRSTPATIALRSTVRARRDLVEHRVAAANQLRAHLQVVFPGAVGLFAAIDSATSLAFLHRFTTQAKADWLTPARLGAWLTKQSYSGRVDPHLLHQRLLAAPRGATGTDADADAAVTLAFVTVLHSLNTQIAALADTIAEQLHVHPDPHIVTSLPRAPAPCAPPGCSPRSATPAAGSPPPTRWPAWPESPPRPANPAKQKPSPSAGPPTKNSATHCATSPETAAEPTPGPKTSTNAPEPAGTTTPTPYASSPAPGPTSSGAAGKTGSPTTPPATTHSNESSPSTPHKPLDPPDVDTGQLIRSPCQSPPRTRTRHDAGMTPLGRLHHVVYDTPDPTASARFWSALLGLPVTYASADWVVVAVDQRHSGMAFQLAPDYQAPVWGDPARPQQIHHDVMVDDVAAAEPLVEALGGRRLHSPDPDGSVWADPAGHPFCLIPRPTWAPPVTGG